MINTLTHQHRGRPLHASLYLVSELLVDSRLIPVVHSASDSALRCGAPYLLIFDINPNVDKEIIKKALGPLSTSVRECKFVLYKQKRSVIFRLVDATKGNALHSFLESDRNIQATFGKSFKALWVSPHIWNQRSVQDYFAVIVRNLPPSFTKQELLLLCTSVLGQSAVSQDSSNSAVKIVHVEDPCYICLLYTSPSPRDRQKSRMPSSA
eukprot:TRINITY_DN2867_c0_g1_i2.p1 TRINITY_DN2867_c0_g1~~TRINITY_DN2867_c0_g1_i2.p1  ORF type:complete len:209 (+),score=20.80 TRINITY_DN2867_c0_g1_i2:334-960(+)